MSRLTVRLPESLHQRLSRQAEREGVSLNHYIVYTLTRTVTAADLEAQRQMFDELAKRYPPEDPRSEVCLSVDRRNPFIHRGLERIQT